MKITNDFSEVVYFMLYASATGLEEQGSIMPSSEVDLKNLPSDMWYQVYFSNTQPVTFDNCFGTPLLNNDAEVTLTIKGAANVKAGKK